MLKQKPIWDQWDPDAAHSYQNRRTKRTEIMFATAGHVYTYQMHTHCLLNVVSGEIEQPQAILIRAIEPVNRHRVNHSAKRYDPSTKSNERAR